MNIYTLTNEDFQVIHKSLSEAFGSDPTDVNFGTITIETVPKNFYKGEHHPMYGHQHSEESRKRMSESQKNTTKHATRGKKRTEFGAKMKGEGNPMYGVTSPFKGKKHDQLTCPHCGKTGGKNGMIQWHFNNCKVK